MYLRDTFKQANMSLGGYFNLFSQKKYKSHMEEASLIDAVKRNVRYSTQSSAINWRKPDGSKAKTFHDHVQHTCGQRQIGIFVVKTPATSPNR